MVARRPRICLPALFHWSGDVADAGDHKGPLCTPSPGWCSHPLHPGSYGDEASSAFKLPFYLYPTYCFFHGLPQILIIDCCECLQGMCELFVQIDDFPQPLHSFMNSCAKKRNESSCKISGNPRIIS